MKTTKTNGVLRPKLRPPRAGPNRLERPRLFARLDKGLAGQVTLVAAPPGYGKTTLLAQWVAQQELPSAWLTLDDADNEPTLFLEELVAAVRTAFSDSCQGVSSMLRRPGLAAPEVLTRELVNDLDDLDEFILVLDDCHTLAQSHTLEVVRRLIYQPPSSLHLVLSSRADPVLPLGALRGRGLLTEVRAADLRFDHQEAEEYLGQVLGRPLRESQLSVLLERTEGWIAGLHLAALSLQGRADVEDGIRDFAGSDRYITDYLMDELWTRLEPMVQSYLETTSILDRMCAPLCQAVVGKETVDSFEGRPMLEWLEEANLFVVSLDEHREWFRYHHLFRDLLNRSLRATRSLKDVAALHVQAAHWLGAHGQVDEAITHHLKADRPELAADLVEAQRRKAIDAEEWRALERWVGRLGPDVVAARPPLVLIHAWLDHERQDWVEMNTHCDRAEELLDRVETPQVDAALRGEIAAMRAEISFFRGDGEHALSQARQALASLPPDYRVARATATLMEGGGLHLLGRNQAAFDVLRRASFGDYGVGIHTRAMVGLALLAFMIGDVDYASHVAEIMLSRATGFGLEESKVFAHFFLGYAAYLRNDLSAAEDHFGLIDPYVSHAVPAKQSLYGLAWVRQARGRPDEALEVMDRASSIISDLDLPLGTEVRLLRARLAALSGRPVGELTPARALLPAPGGEPLSLQVFFEFSALTAAALLVLEGSQDDLDASDAGLQRLLAISEASGNTLRAVQCLILLALASDRRGRNPEALDSLARAVALAKPGRLVRLFPEMGDRVQVLLQALRVRGPGDAFLDELTASFASQRPVSSAALEPGPSGPSRDYVLVTLLTNRERDVLELLEQRLSNKEIAKRLVISPATVKRHTLTIYSKLGVGGRREAVAKAQRMGLLRTPG